MLIQLLYPYIKFALGTLYPAYKTWKALKRKDETTRRRWMKYWVSFGAFQMFELVADITIAFILPFYVELKLAFMVWLVLGTKLIFDSIVNRELTKREKSIDRLLMKLNKARDEMVAIIWHEISRCSIKIITALMSGGMSVLAVKSPEESNQPSPNCSDEEEGNHCEQESLPYITEEPDFNENMVSMEWAAITINNGHTNSTSKELPVLERVAKPRAITAAGLRKSARREQQQQQILSLKCHEIE